MPPAKSGVFCSKPGPDAKRVRLRDRLLQSHANILVTIGAGQSDGNALMDQVNPEISGKLTKRISRDALLARAIEEPDLTWRVIATLNAFRILIAAALIVLFFVTSDPRIFGSQIPTLFAATAAAYLVLAIVFGITIQKRWGAFGVQAVTQLLVDILAVVTMTYTSGGISSGLGGLLVAFIGAGALVLPVQLSAILAAAATFAVLGEEVFAGISGFTTNYPAAGLLCAIMFAIGLAARPLANRIQVSEDLARQRGVDLQNLSELNEYIVQHLRESIVVVDADDTVRLSNGSAAQLLGVVQSLRGRPLSSASEQLANYIKLWRLDNAHSSHPELTMVSAGNSIRITAHLAPLGKDGDRSGPTLLFLEDASLLNARVQQSKLASLGRLSASIAHEIRNPVGAMSHAAQLLGETEGLAEGDRRLTEIIRTHSSRVSHIIDNVLQLSRRESSRPKLLTLRPWLADFATEFADTLELQEGELTTDAVADELDVRMDPSHLRQVLWNLCDNAVKYASETGGILVELKAGMQDDGRPFLEVCDHGNGVDPTSAEKIFEPFYTERSGGTGLGLYMSRELCELNRSTLLYLDRPGGGSIFRIVFADPNRWERQD